MSNPTLPDVELAKLANASRDTIRRWKNSPEFKAELKSRLQEVWGDAERMAVNNMIELAKKGDFKSLKYILDNLGYAAEQKVRVEDTTTINITITDEDKP